MSIVLFAQVYRMKVGSPTDKAVLLALADSANDEAGGLTWIPIGSREGDQASEGTKLDLIAKTELSERAIRNSLRRLEEAGHISREEVPGKGVNYWVHPVSSGEHETPAPRAGGHDVPPAADAETPARRAPHPGTTCPQTLKNPNNPARARGARGGLGKTPAPAARPVSPPSPVPEQSLEAHREQIIRKAIERANGGQVPPWLARAGLQCACLSDDEDTVGLTVIVPFGQRDAVEALSGRLMEIVARDTSLTVRWVRVETPRARQAA